MLGLSKPSNCFQHAVYLLRLLLCTALPSGCVSDGVRSPPAASSLPQEGGGCNEGSAQGCELRLQRLPVAISGTSSTTSSPIYRVFSRSAGIIELLVDDAYEFEHTPNITGILQGRPLSAEEPVNVSYEAVNVKYEITFPPTVPDLSATDPDPKGFNSHYTDGFVDPFNKGVYNRRVARFNLAGFATVAVLDLTATDPALKGFIFMKNCTYANANYEITYHPKEVTEAIDEIKGIEIQNDACKILHAQFICCSLLAVNATYEITYHPKEVTVTIAEIKVIEIKDYACTTGTSSTTSTTINRVFTRIAGIIELLIDDAYDFAHSPTSGNLAY